MLKKCYTSIFFLLLTTFCVNAQAATFDEAVSLGYGCQVAHQLEANGLRKLAYPFDWFHTSFEGLLSFITYKGKNFLDLDKIRVVGPYPGDPICLEVHDLLYGFISYHDFSSTPPMANYSLVKSKYDRRVKRFFDLLNSRKRVLFVCQFYTRVQVEQLDELLHSSYPNLVYTLVAIGSTEDFHSNWGLPRIENYFMENVFWDWRGDFVRWIEILSQHSVTPSVRPRPAEERW